MTSELWFDVWMEIPKGKQAVAKRIVEKYFSNKNKKNPTYPVFARAAKYRMLVHFNLVTVDVDIVEDAVEPLARDLIEGMKSDEPFVFSWSYVTHAGGGSFVIMRSLETFWIIPSVIAEDWIRERTADQECGEFPWLRELKHLCQRVPKELKKLEKVKGLLECAADIIKKAKADLSSKEKADG